MEHFLGTFLGTFLAKNGKFGKILSSNQQIEAASGRMWQKSAMTSKQTLGISKPVPSASRPPLQSILSYTAVGGWARCVPCIIWD